MAFNYAPMVATASRLIDRFGMDGTLIKTPAGTGGDSWDPGSQTGGTPVAHACRWVEIEYEQRDRDGQLIQAQDKRALISTAGLGVAVDSGDALQAEGITYAIISSRPLRPGGTVILWDAQVRR